MVKIVIRCPKCSKKRTIDVEENLVRNSERGVTAITVAEALICDHSFVAYIDRNLSVRDCFIADFQIEIPQLVPAEDIDEVLIPTDEKVDIYLISINISSLALAYIIRACFHKEPIMYLNELTIINDHLIHFFDFIFGDTFKYEISFASQEEYKKNKAFNDAEQKAKLITPIRQPRENIKDKNAETKNEAQAEAKALADYILSTLK